MTLHDASDGVSCYPATRARAWRINGTKRQMRHVRHARHKAAVMARVTKVTLSPLSDVYARPRMCARIR